MCLEVLHLAAREGHAAAVAALLAARLPLDPDAQDDEGCTVGAVPPFPLPPVLTGHVSSLLPY